MPERASRGAVLIALARASLARRLGAEPPPETGDAAGDEPWFAEPGAAFVTLHLHGALRGCVGSLEATRPLADDVRENAVAAALRDDRFAPLTAAELPQAEIEVTVLSPPEPLRFTGEADALAQLRPGEDGVVLRWREHRATFLPQVWETLPSPEEFLARLKQKAGLAADFWHPDLRLERYSARKWSEADVNAP